MGYAKKHLWKPKPTDYEKFRDAIKYDFSQKYKDGRIKNEDELAELMQLAGYHRSMKGKKKGEQPHKLNPSQKQLTFAWNFLKGLSDVGKFSFTETYEKRTVKRASYNVYIRGKLYRKGQFLPKDFEVGEEK